MDLPAQLFLASICIIVGIVVIAEIINKISTASQKMQDIK